ncbi:hypothetical protein Aperf_G00000033576 [Anoplocephala perfoliata]
MRRDFDPALHCRMASVKDNDDLTAIFNSKTDVLRELYGEYYISELVEAQNDEMKAVVLESSETRRKHSMRGQLTIFDNPLSEELSTSNKILNNLSTRTFMENVDLYLDNFQGSQSTDDLRSNVLSDVLSADKDANISQGNWIRRHLTGYFGANSLPEVLENAYLREKNNAFIVQLYGLLPQYDNRSRDFLTFMFNQFPGIDYAVISVPRLEPETSLLQEFFRVKPRPFSTVAQELYVYHRANLIRYSASLTFITISSDFKVRPAIREDLKEILDLAQGMHPFDRKLFTSDVKNYMKMATELDGTPLFCYVAFCLDKLVGVLFARAEENINWLKANYNVEEYVYLMQHGKFEFATIIHFLLSSNVQARSKLFIREVMRQSGKTCFFYYIYPPCTPDTKIKLNTPLSCLADFYAIRPRRQIIYPTDLLVSEKGPLNSTLTCALDDPPPAVYHISRNLIMEPKIVINARIIVVGASSTSLAFLERLAFSFMQGRRRMGQLSLRTIASVIPGTLTAIDRNRKLIQIDNKHEMSYDFMILAPGTQYHPPIPIGFDPKYLAERRCKDPCELSTTKHKASNLFLINDEHSATEAITYVEKYLISDTTDQGQMDRNEKLKTDVLLENPDSQKNPPFSRDEGPLIIFGDCPDAYACVNGLLQMGVPGIRIIMMHPFRRPDPQEEEDEAKVEVKPTCHSLTSVFEDYVVESTIHEEMERLGVRTFKRCALVCWNDDPTVLYVDEIESANFMIEGTEKRIRCVAFFSFVEKKIDYIFFKAVNDACLVFDKQLVIDANFHTSDPCIRAAGPATKYHRTYYNDKFTHALCSSLEIGEKLGDAFLKEFDPSVEMPEAPPKDNSHLLPQFEMPRIIYATLPGSYNYLHIWPPGYRKNILLRLQDPDFGRSLVTGAPDHDSGYFHIHVNDLNQIARISIPISNYFCLYSTHERAVNNLVSRYDEGLITDLYSFFEEPWAMALFHDRFSELKKEIHELCYKPKEEGQETLIDFVRTIVDPSEEVSEEALERIHLEHLLRGHKAEIEKKTIDFVASNFDLLPMYAKPDMIRQVP